MSEKHYYGGMSPMEYNAFAGGIEPGGLRNTKEISILICYILDRAGKAVSEMDLMEIIQSNGMANYFETASAITELLENGNIICTDEVKKELCVSDNGIMISRQLHNELPLTIRQKAIAATLKLLQKQRTELENPVTVTPLESGGFNVNLRIQDGIRDLMSLDVFVPSKKEAKNIRQIFHSNPERLYSVVLAAVLGDSHMISAALKEYLDE